MTTHPTDTQPRGVGTRFIAGFATVGLVLAGIVGIWTLKSSKDSINATNVHPLSSERSESQTSPSILSLPTKTTQPKADLPEGAHRTWGTSRRYYPQPQTTVSEHPPVISTPTATGTPTQPGTTDTRTLPVPGGNSAKAQGSITDFPKPAPAQRPQIPPRITIPRTSTTPRPPSSSTAPAPSSPQTTPGQPTPQPPTTTPRTPSPTSTTQSSSPTPTTTVTGEPTPAQRTPERE